MKKNHIASSKNLSRVSIKFANILFTLGVLLSILVSIYAAFRISNPIYASTLGDKAIVEYYIRWMVIGLTFSVLFFFGLIKFNDELKVNLSILFIAIGISIYAFETYLEAKRKTKDIIFSERRAELKKEGVKIETRTIMEVLDDLKKSGTKEVYPNVFPLFFRNNNGLATENGRIYPLSGLSNITTVLANEGNFYPVIETDEHGFHNPKGLYKTDQVDIMLVGDSFTEGMSVKTDQNIAAQLRKLGYNVINIGKGGNGALIELAGLMEYAQPLRPKIVLWLFYLNDIAELKMEMQSPILKKYLDDDFSQNLITRQQEIHDVLKSYVLGEIENYKEIENNRKAEIGLELEKERVKFANNPLLRVIKLNNLRTRLKFLSPLQVAEYKKEWLIFEKILKKSVETVSKWEGRFYFIPLPSIGHYLPSGPVSAHKKYHKLAMNTATKLNIPVIDPNKTVLLAHPKPISLFPPFGQHYNAEGYRLLTKEINRRIKEDSKSKARNE